MATGRLGCGRAAGDGVVTTAVGVLDCEAADEGVTVVLAVGGASPHAIRMTAANERAAWRLEPIADLNGRHFAIVMLLITIVEMCRTELIKTR